MLSSLQRKAFGDKGYTWFHIKKTIHIPVYFLNKEHGFFGIIMVSDANPVSEVEWAVSLLPGYMPLSTSTISLYGVQ